MVAFGEVRGLAERHTSDMSRISLLHEITLSEWLRVCQPAEESWGGVFEWQEWGMLYILKAFIFWPLTARYSQRKNIFFLCKIKAKKLTEKLWKIQPFIWVNVFNSKKHHIMKCSCDMGGCKSHCSSPVWNSLNQHGWVPLCEAYC